MKPGPMAEVILFHAWKTGGLGNFRAGKLHFVSQRVSFATALEALQMQGLEHCKCLSQCPYSG
jgi:hypothetical protein